MIRKTISTSLLLLTTSSLTVAQGIQDQLREYPDYLVSGLSQFLLERTNQVILTGTGLSVLLAYRYDEKVRDYSQENGLMPNTLSHYLDQYGGGFIYPVTLAGVAAASYLQGRTWQEGLRRMKYVVTSFTCNAFLTGLIKKGTSRERPDGSSRTAFPSGHTSGSFVVAATLSELYGWRLGFPFYLVAGLVGAHRIHDDKHWLTDVLAGAALGTVVARGFGVAYSDEEKGGTTPRVTADKNGVYLTLIIPLN